MTGKCQKIFRVGMETLWDNRETLIVFWQNVKEMFFCELRMALRVDKRSNGSITAPEIFVEQGAKGGIGDTSNGSHVKKDPIIFVGYMIAMFFFFSYHSFMRVAIKCTNVEREL